MNFRRPVGEVRGRTAPADHPDTSDAHVLHWTSNRARRVIRLENGKCSRGISGSVIPACELGGPGALGPATRLGCPTRDSQLRLNTAASPVHALPARGRARVSRSKGDPFSAAPLAEGLAIQTKAASRPDPLGPARLSKTRPDRSLHGGQGHADGGEGRRAVRLSGPMAIFTTIVNLPTRPVVA